jgi:hypothetical protein
VTAASDSERMVEPGDATAAVSAVSAYPGDVSGDGSDEYTLLGVRGVGGRAYVPYCVSLATPREASIESASDESRHIESLRLDDDEQTILDERGNEAEPKVSSDDRSVLV